MRIKRIRLMNGYKRFKDLTIDLGDNPARIVALVGPNGCGKSSVLDGILYHARAHEQIGSGSVRDYNYHSMDGLPSFNYKNVEIIFTDGPFSSIIQQRRATGNVGTIFSFRSPYRYNSVLKIRETRSTETIRLNNYGAGDASSIDEKMENNYRRLYAMYNRYMNENDVRPTEAKAKIIGDLNGALKNCLSLELSSIGSVEDGKGTLYFNKPGHPRDFEFNVLSSGEKEVVDILLDLYLRKEDYNDTVFLIDEPELHINTSIQRKLLVEIDKMVGPECQILMTTHSIGFLRALQTDIADKCQIVLFKDDCDLASTATTLRPTKLNQSVWREIFSIALDDLANLVSPKTIVYCEGRAEPNASGEERGLDATVFNIIFGTKYPDTLFVSSGGNTELDQRSAIAISILGKVFPDVKILVLKDRDMASGNNTTETERQLYLNNNPLNHRVLKRWELENYLFDKEILTKYCSENGLQFDHTAYDLLVSDIDNNNLKDKTGHIKNICGMKFSISPEKFKIQLSNFVVEQTNCFRELESCIFDRK